MKVIAFTSRKGGSGKSTLAAHLSVYADAPNAPAVLIDCDPQGSLALWHELRQAETPVLVKCEARELADTVEAARRDGVKWVLIDTPPHNTADIAAAMRVADLAVIPFRPAVFDIAAVAATLEMARAIGKPVLPVINSAPPRRGLAAAHVVNEAREALFGMNATPWAGQITTRAAFAHALASGQAVGEFEPGSAAASEVSDLWQATRRALGMKEGKSP
ncbi:ParA family protein [Methylobacterium sp. BTF04]|uniref:ParA family protein n=1 Tax=Methylobacterium sp. BTF04 TaxID=2708300 RepID=UPI0013D37A1A|nr:ParA family protein [Methylobacterium sp. BTF04]NEU14939.1 ParA family protein [Methylobacterium sp. BTF04]